MQAITRVDLTDSGVAKFNKFFNDFAKDNVSIEATMLEMLNKLVDRLSEGSSAVYELGQRYTTTGRPEIIDFEKTDYEITFEDI